MISTIEKIAQDLSLLLVMVDASDTGGVDAVELLLTNLSEEFAKASEHEAIEQACLSLVSSRSQVDTSEYIHSVQDFVSKLQSYLQDPNSVSFSSGSVASTEIGEFFDPEFLSEFIGKHEILLDEFEGAVVDFRFKAADASEADVQEFLSYLKAYLHNLKGDAGTVGLVGIERVTHCFESLLEQHAVEKLLRPLVNYKEWVSGSLEQLKIGTDISPTSTAFLNKVSSDTGFELSGNSSAAKESETRSELVSPEKSAKVVEEPSMDDSTYSISSDSDLLGEFFAEAADHLSQVEEVLLESQTNLSADDLDTVFRGVHSLKGASAYFNLLEINETSHLLENLLDDTREGQRTFDQDLLELCLSYVDLQKSLMSRCVHAASNDGTVTRSRDVDSFKERLAEIAGTVSTAKAAPAEVIERAVVAEEVVDTKAVETPAADTLRAKEQSVIKSFVKVDTERLDRLVDSVGEMVIYSSMLIRACRDLLGDNEEVQRTTRQVEKFSRDLQGIGMSMRLDPIKGLFQKMSRLVWDVSKKLDKDIRFSMSGEDTELDRNVIEKLADPLMHMVRNAVDHGIEPAEERIAAGKSPAGQVHLSACHSGGSIHIIIKDDGRGLDAEKLREKAVRMNVIGPEQNLTQQECFQLIFAAGFSTAKQVTDVSGRGVGMDVVRSNIESMRGHIRIDSELGVGTTFDIALPLTLAIIDGIEVLVGWERFIIPTLSVVEFMKPELDSISTTSGQAENFEFRGQFLPLFRLADLYGIQPNYSNPTDGVVVILESGGEQVALLIDEVVGTCQTVIKNLGQMFGEVKGLAGCAIMSNGEIGLIVDIRSLTELARSDYPHGSKLGSLEGCPRNIVELDEG